ncbi:MAG TPA: manganese efflux pump [Streptosporangiaceae bacterium]|nr:manganese efflux pump [Streptosporangiaceae bacterium]
MLALLLVAASVGLSNFAAAVSLGVGGVDARTRLRVGLVFGAFESGMPIVGLLIGDHVAGQLGRAGHWIGGALLIGVGLYTILGSVRARRAARAAMAGAVHPVADAGATAPSDSAPGRAAPSDSAPGHAATGSGGSVRLLLSALALSLDNLVVGFALGTYQVAILVGATIIGAVSVALSLVGLELGARLGGWAGGRSDQLGGVILVSVGVAVAAGALS